MAEYITELANDIAKSCPDLVENGCGNDNCVACLAFKLIGLGYTKQSDTADVVPKSEVDKLIGKFECFLCHVTGSRLSKHTYDLRTMETVATDCINEAYNDGYGEGYKECAREIFEEIESISSDFPLYGNINTVILSERDLAFIKKKYTEGKDEQASTRDPI